VYPRYGSTRAHNKKSLTTLSELAKQYNYHQDYLSQLIRKGEIKGEKVGRSWCTTPAEIERYKIRKQYVTLGYLLKPYLFEIALLCLGCFVVATSLWYWHDSTQVPAVLEAETELSSDLDVSVSHKSDA